MQSVHLQRKLVQHLQELGLKLSKPELTNLALWCHGLATSPDCHLTNVALGLPIPGQRDNLVQRLRRFLDHEPPSWSGGYGHLVRHIFANWQGSEVALVMDRTDLGQRWSILTLGVAYRKRLLPMTWRILPFGGTGEDVQKQLLSQVAPLLPSASRIHFYGDCEFRAVGLQQYCRSQKWHWHWGVKSDTYVDSGWVQRHASVNRAAHILSRRARAADLHESGDCISGRSTRQTVSAASVGQNLACRPHARWIDIR